MFLHTARNIFFRSEFDLQGKRVLSFLSYRLSAGVAKLVYALDSKSSELCAHVGSTPTLGTQKIS